MEECPAAFSTKSQRLDSMGVTVKATSSDTRMENAMVRPKLYMNRPTMPPMKATGRNTVTRDSVVARTARPISRVPWMAAATGDRPISSMCR